MFVVVISIITLGIYGLYWQYKVFKEMKEHTGEGVGGVIGLVIGHPRRHRELVPPPLGDREHVREGGAGEARPRRHRLLEC